MRKGKELNNKGFTLIELLAVIVILAVIMVIASTSVLSSMNESRKKSLLNSAASAKDAFDSAYAELSLINSTTLVGLTNIYNSGGLLYNGGNVKVTITSAVATALDINDTDYDLTNSWVYFNKTTNVFTVCFMAKNTGSFYVSSAATATASTKITSANDTTMGAGMWACSNGQKSWT